MQQEEKEDPALAARKADLLAILDASGIGGDVLMKNKEIGQSPAIGSEIGSKTELQDRYLQNGQHIDINTELLDLDPAIEQGFNDTEKISQSVFTVNDSESGSSDLVEVTDVVVCSKRKDTFSVPLMALSFDEEYNAKKGNFTKGCKWSPDGSCLLVASEDKMLRLFNLPSQVASGDIQDESWFLQESTKHQKPALQMQEGECIYDYTWFPTMNSSSPESCCFAVTCRDFPVHLWDAWHGKLICSYQPFDHLDELVAAHSVSFNLDGTELFCGFNRCIRVFRTCRPGKESSKIESKDQPGIISCMAFNPVLPSVFAAGSYLGNLGLYSTDRNTLFCRIDGCPGGITQILFSSDGTKLFSGARRNNELLCWDLRNPGKMLWSFKREVKTNQRIYFDLDPQSNSYILSGSTSGSVHKWDLEELGFPVDENPLTVKPSFTFSAHQDCCNGLSINPHYPVLATSSGQRHFPEPQSMSDVESSDEENNRPLFVDGNSNQENSVKLWWFGEQ